VSNSVVSGKDENALNDISDYGQWVKKVQTHMFSLSGASSLMLGYSFATTGPISRSTKTTTFGYGSGYANNCAHNLPLQRKQSTFVASVYFLLPEPQFPRSTDLVVGVPIDCLTEAKYVTCLGEPKAKTLAVWPTWGT
jgi:hypothetical protein